MDNHVERKFCSFCGQPGRRGMLFAGGLGAMMCKSCVDHYHQTFESASKTQKAFDPPWESMSDAEILSNLPLISQTADQVEEFLVEWVELARSRKLSWAEIGKAMGISRQAAWERFSQRVESLRSGASTA